MAKLSISLAQMNIALGDVQRNTTSMQRMVADAARRGSHLVLLPELWSTGYDWVNYRDLAVPVNGGMFSEMSTVAQKAKISVFGSMLEKRANQFSNTGAFVAANGRTMGLYRKIHLFRLFNEDRYLQAGSSWLTMDLPWGATSTAICYDLRFPEMFRRMADEGAQLILLVAEWPLVRIEHWRTLIRARAIENQVFIAAVNACGETGDTVFGGHSMIVDPWGKIVVEGGEEPMVITGEIEMDAVREAREAMTILQDRRTDLY
ncbi:MAG: carbon-nitrogen family hydrolase [Chloroflexota bacterium]